MARMIDAGSLRDNITDIYGGSDRLIYLADVLSLIDDQPTLTPPNETPPCYQPDGDGCAYQCYDGQDKPIEKCKECPLCCSDKQRHYTPPNEALTLEHLRASTHGKIKDSTLQSICNRANEIACRPPEGEA